MRLKQLELQGYKTFASKTEFLFTGGLTAIIGPNGSGKSNVADAIQWVLGEQNYTLLRAKRSEDMIFGGSNERPRLGMAQAVLTLDNGDGWLPVDYGEVVITRRAYRSGENEYYLNGTRVRLRDITDLLAHSGLGKRTYTVVGQGLIDQALSLRPGERRALIEEAAGISGHQARRDQALRQLDETRHNLERVHDILQEIEPRLRYLKRQAERAQERLQIQADLDAQLRLWYGYRWHRALADLHAARQQEADAASLVEARRAALRRLAQTDADLHQRHAELRGLLGDWHRASSQLHRQAETAQRELAVGSERLRQLAERRLEVEREIEQLQARLDAQARQVEAAEAGLAAEESNLHDGERQVAQAQDRLQAAEAERNVQRQQLAAARDHAARLQNEVTAHERRLLELDGRQRGLAEEQAKVQAELAAAQARQAQLAPQIANQQAHQAELEAASLALVAQRQALLAAIAQAEASLSQQAEQLARQQRAADRLRDQLDLLQRLKDEGEGYSGGARSIIRAVPSAASGVAPRRGGGPTEERPALRGVIGAVADQLSVPAELELAIETALGGRLQDIIVERWQDAEQAIAWLKRTGGGRATLLPLDTLRPAARLRPPSGPGVVGLAADLVSAEPRLQVVVDYLLGRVVVTRDLPTARRMLDMTQEHPTVVTLEGDIVRPGGSVSGGSTASRREQGVLGRERALRELPGQIDAARATLASLEQAQAALGDQARAKRQEQAELERRLAAAAQEQQAQSAALARLQGQAAQIAQEARRHQERLAANEREQGEHAQRNAQVQARLAELAGQVAAAQQAVAGIEATQAQLETADLLAELMERRATARILTARVASQRSALAEGQRAYSQLQHETGQKQERARVLVGEHDGLEQHLQAVRAGVGELSGQIEAYAQRIDPAEAELAALEAQRGQLSAEEAEQRRQGQHEEQSHNRAQLALQRAQDELAHLRGEIEHDVGLVELEQSEAVTDQPPLPLRPLVERLPVVESLGEGVEVEIRRLRAQYSRLGSVNPNAPQEYAAAQERHEFLTGQSADLEQAANTLQAVVKELDEVMQREFMATFRAVAREFKDQFTTLFGGGTARLELTEPDSPMDSGIEITVRPPGKRAQALPLLSGGERSLTAAALILSILKVSPPPFCVLDEVDAALDESNVDRFRAALREAAHQTQFIVITHNRGTIEAADTIYGVSMGADSASQVLSLHLEAHDGRRELVAD